MFLSRWSVNRPIAMTAFIIVLIMIGASLYSKISIDLLPNMEIPTVLIRCEYKGASPTEIEVEVVKRIEDAISSIDGIQHISSSSLEDQGQVQVEFIMGTNVDIAATDIREALNRKIHLGYSVIVLGEACQAFAKWGFLPTCLEDLTAVETAPETATVVYHFEADVATRLLRCPPLAPRDDAVDFPHLLTLHLPDGQTIPDGFTYRDSRVLGLVNGLDVTLLSRLRCRNRFV